MSEPTALPRSCRVCGDEFTPASKYGNSATACPGCRGAHDGRQRKPRYSPCVGCGVVIEQHGRGRTRLRCDTCLSEKALRARIAHPSSRRNTVPCHACERPLYDTGVVPGAATYCPDCGPGPGIKRRSRCSHCNESFWWTHRGGPVTPDRKWLCLGCAESVRWCRSCDRVLDRDCFANTKGKRDGKTAHCRECASQRYHAQTPDKKLAAAIRKFNISVDRYKAMLNSQGGACAICRLLKVDAPRGYLMVDHDHSCCPGDASCGRCVRALLCQHCNFAIGLMRDDPHLLVAASNYLIEHQGEPPP